MRKFEQYLHFFIDFVLVQYSSLLRVAARISKLTSKKKLRRSL